VLNWGRYALSAGHQRRRPLLSFAACLASKHEAAPADAAFSVVHRTEGLLSERLRYSARFRASIAAAVRCFVASAGRPALMREVMRCLDFMTALPFTDGVGLDGLDDIRLPVLSTLGGAASLCATAAPRALFCRRRRAGRHP
jgi:hypothetical protein